MRDELTKLVRLMLEADEKEDPEVLRMKRAERKQTMEKFASMLAGRLNLTNVRYLARSKRLEGAYTFSAIDENNENVVLKLQPYNELEGYRKLKKLTERLPDEVSRHLPVIHHILVPSSVGISMNDVGLSQPFGIIVMEQLEELPGNLFDLITEPPIKSARSLNALIKDRETFAEIVNVAVDRARKSINSAISKSTRKVNPDEEFERLRKMLISASYDPEISQEEDDLVIYGLRKAFSKKVELWYKGLGVTHTGHVYSLVQMIINEILMPLGRRAIPKEPGHERPGALSKIKGVRELMKAIEFLKSVKVNLSDVHGNNIMLRPGTGEMVLADLGHFS